MSDHCTSCLLPACVPNSALDETSTCHHCREFVTLDMSLEEGNRTTREIDLEESLEKCRGQSEYDCLLNLSGGKDSCFLLYKLVRERGLKVLAFTTDMNVPKVAWQNIRRTIDLLDVDHLTYKPPTEFYKKLFRFLLQNQEERGAVRTVCYVCALV